MAQCSSAVWVLIQDLECRAQDRGLAISEDSHLIILS